MAALKKEIKLFIVRSLAVFNTPTETVELVNQEYGVIVTKQQCEKYDPTKRAGENLSEELKKDFEKTREMFLGKPENIPIANLSVRLQRYENMFIGTKNNVMKLKIQEQAAKDMGGQYTNRQEITGKGGEPLQTTFVQATQEQVNEAVRRAQEEY
ncbi:DUF2280 domain-containing protein [Acinetobacter bereziniae]|uniref:DUF2280 domain-containing protein n=1 Tax=Acinetobacter bereziniae NIPH 3 TaxID=1217651 RepID=N8X855_ACIBZ|nr:DUF2280 domain-containing protein [Acinetobacter bereziniae]ENV20411.1 hypothetical protein F963_03696 [Acinetobacter bereziniae NIPH 3]TNL46587.1 DUF2280 domain-containing protein [Acinetobacter bereziniae]TNL56718.1 DUF2280 domain-containing protein [Acinetobacter bereziniae]